MRRKHDAARRQAGRSTISLTTLSATKTQGPPSAATAKAANLSRSGAAGKGSHDSNVDATLSGKGGRGNPSNTRNFVGGSPMSIMVRTHSAGNSNGSTNSDIFSAAAVGDKQRVLRHLDKDGDQVDVRDGRRWSLLHHASFHGHLEVVRALLDAGADKEARTAINLTPLCLACQNGHQAVSEELLARGSCASQGVVDGDKSVGDSAARKLVANFPPALFIAAREGHLSLVELLLNKAGPAEAIVAGPDGKFAAEVFGKGVDEDVRAQIRGVVARAQEISQEKGLLPRAWEDKVESGSSGTGGPAEDGISQSAFFAETTSLSCREQPQAASSLGQAESVQLQSGFTLPLHAPSANASQVAERTSRASTFSPGPTAFDSSAIPLGPSSYAASTSVASNGRAGWSVWSGDGTSESVARNAQTTGRKATNPNVESVNGGDWSTFERNTTIDSVGSRWSRRMAETMGEIKSDEAYETVDIGGGNRNRDYANDSRADPGMVGVDQSNRQSACFSLAVESPLVAGEGEASGACSSRKSSNGDGSRIIGIDGEGGNSDVPSRRTSLSCSSSGLPSPETWHRSPQNGFSQHQRQQQCETSPSVRPMQVDNGRSTGAATVGVRALAAESSLPPVDEGADDDGIINNIDVAGASRAASALVGTSAGSSSTGVARNTIAAEFVSSFACDPWLQDPVPRSATAPPPMTHVLMSAASNYVTGSGGGDASEFEDKWGIAFSNLMDLRTLYRASSRPYQGSGGGSAWLAWEEQRRALEETISELNMRLAGKDHDIAELNIQLDERHRELRLMNGQDLESLKIPELNELEFNIEGALARVSARRKRLGNCAHQAKRTTITKSDVEPASR